MAASAKKKLNACIAVVVVVALLFTYVATGAARHGFISTLGWPQNSITAMVLTDNDGDKHSIKVSTYNYYFAAYYNNMYQMSYYMSQLGATSSNAYPDFDKALSKQTHEDDEGNTQRWDEYMKDTVVDQIKSTYAYYYAAVKANDGKEPEIKESQQTELDEAIDEYRETAESYGYSLDAYLRVSMGNGVNEKVFRRERTISYIAENYEDDYKSELSSKDYSDEEYNNYLDENRDDLVSVDIKYYECEDEDEAKEFVEALKDDGSNFADLAYKYSEDEDDLDPVETTYIDFTRNTLVSLGQSKGVAIAQADADEEEEEEEEDHVDTYSGLDYLYSKDRKAGEKFNYGSSVVYMIKPVYLSDTHPVTVRHILITPDSMKTEDEDEEDTEETTDEESSEETEETEQTEEELDALASDKAKEILDEYLAGEQTEEAFAALAKEYSEDSNAEDGGIYENVTPNTMVPTFNAWIFDSSRKSGDTAIVKTEFGYHIMYFVSTSDLTVWQYTAQQALASVEIEKLLDDFDDANTIKVTWLGSRYMEKDTDISN